jgi:hypothetical protein
LDARSGELAILDSVAEPNRKHRNRAADGRLDAAFPSEQGHPSVEQLMAEQGTGPITDIASLRGDFWPEEESIEDFLAALHEWRGHNRTGPAA